MTTDKGHGKVEIKIGNLNFAAEGEQAWLAEQLSKVIKAGEIAAVHEASTNASEVEGPTAQSSRGRNGTPESLASYLKSKGGDAKQVQRFLATAGWLYRRGASQLDTAAVSKALLENHQKRLSNPAECLNQNCTKGYCEKTKDGFFITPEGWQALGDAQ